jgi:formate dehydrogenase iron-sulfur subunit
MSTVHPRALDYADSKLEGMIPDESELTAGTRIEPGKSYGFFTDTTLCIGCKACEVACKEWNALPADDVRLTGMSYDNTGGLGANTWRHVAFIEKISQHGERATEMAPFQSNWLMMSDVCKHCGKAHKCTLCYDCLKGGLEPACAKACPTDSIQFGELSDLHERAERRVNDLHAQGATDAYIYGTLDGPGATGGLEQLHAFFLLTDDPEVYNLPTAPSRPSDRVAPSLASGLATIAGLALAAAVLLTLSGRDDR